MNPSKNSLREKIKTIVDEWTYNGTDSYIIPTRGVNKILKTVHETLIKELPEKEKEWEMFNVANPLEMEHVGFMDGWNHALKGVKEILNRVLK